MPVSLEGKSDPQEDKYQAGIKNGYLHSFEHRRSDKVNTCLPGRKGLVKIKMCNSSETFSASPESMRVEWMRASCQLPGSDMMAGARGGHGHLNVFIIACMQPSTFGESDGS